MYRWRPRQQRLETYICIGHLPNPSPFIFSIQGGVNLYGTHLICEINISKYVSCRTILIFAILIFERVELNRLVPTRQLTSRQVETLRRRQGARILLGMLRSHRRNSLARAVEAWRSAGVRRVQDGRRLQSIALRTAHRQRVFFLGKAWSRIVWAAGEREATRSRKVRL